MYRKNDWQFWVLVVSLAITAMLACFIDMFEDRQTFKVPAKPDNEYCAPDYIHLRFLRKDIYINGKHINNWELFCPFTEYNNRFYVCTDELMRECLGFEINVDREKNIVLLKEGQASYEAVSVGGIGCHFEDRPVSTLRDNKVLETNDLEIFDGLTHNQMAIEEQDAERIEKYLEKFPILAKLGFEPREELHIIHERGTCFGYANDNYYIPLDWLMEAFGWTYYYDEISGLYISTDETTAEQWYELNENNRSFVDGLSAYMKQRNPKLTKERALYYEYIFRHEGRVYNLEELFLVAVCRGEGGFREDVIGGGAIGLMQIMPGTGARQGYTVDDLLDPHKNVEFGAMYISNLARTYGGDLIITMSAYNQGSGTIATGLYRTDYAERILLHKDNITQWLKSMGYSTEFYEEIPRETTVNN